MKKCGLARRFFARIPLLNRRNIARFAASTLLCLFSVNALAASAILQWTEPTQNTDGTPLTDLARYDIYSGCQQSGQYERPVIQIPAPADTASVSGLPDTGTCYFSVKAIKRNDIASNFSNEASQILGTLGLSLPVQDLSVSWQETPSMTIALVEEATNGGSASTWSTGTLAAAPSEGDLIVIAAHVNGSGNTLGVATGFTEVVQRDGPETDTYSIQYKVAGASEGTSYSGSINTSDSYSVITFVFSSTEGWASPALDQSNALNNIAASNSHPTTSITVSDKSVAVAFWFEDGSTGAITSSTNSYSTPIAQTSRNTGGAYKFFTTGASTTTTFTSNNPARVSHTQHLSFKEGSGGAGPSAFRGLTLLGVGS